MLVTALEANEDVPKMENVTDCLLHEEGKLTERVGSDARREGTNPSAITVGNLATSGRIQCSEWDKRKGDSNERSLEVPR